jgi:hypothetical protein
LSQLAVLPAGKPWLGTNPKTTIARGQQASNIAAGEMLTGWRLPRDEPNAIKANYPEFRAEPEITVGGLSNRADGAFEEAFGDRPGFVRVLINVK